MKIYTSYFAQIKNFPKNLVGLSTAMWNPKWLRPKRSQNGIIWFDIPPFKPGRACQGLCNGSCYAKYPNSCLFLRTYDEQLRQLDADKIFNNFYRLEKEIKEREYFDTVDFALLVYEAPNNKCSERGIIQKWFRNHDVKITEWQKEQK